MNPRLFIFRHGEVKKKTKEYDALTSEGESFRNWLPDYFMNRKITLSTAYCEWSEDMGRCMETISRLSCAFVDFGARSEIKTMNAAIAKIRSGDHVLCCRSEAIESGQLYHIVDFDLHTPFCVGEHGQNARKTMASSYHKIYVCELKNDVWHQTRVDDSFMSQS